MVLEKIMGAFTFLSGNTGKNGTAFELIMVIVLTILIAYIVGVMISHIVDRKLGDIAIQMPKINVNAPTQPQPQPQPPDATGQHSEHRRGKHHYSWRPAATGQL